MGSLCGGDLIVQVTTHTICLPHEMLETRLQAL